ncbi:MAG: hypothetical protein Q8K30_05130 [Candidatus Gracilibacteria bacterium]|nr:hypothetical protein [Candidatus Gracilibacteria bacterium]
MSKKIIVGDFSGIQGYLYNIQKNKSATKRLKGRSAFIEILLEKVKVDLKNALGNCDDYIISGGKFIIICNDFNQDRFDIFKKDLELKLLNQFYGELKIIFGVSIYDENDFKNSLNKAFEDLEKHKNKAFSSIFIENGKWNSDKFVFNDDRGTESVCKFSRGDLIKVKKGFDSYIDDILDEEGLGGIGQNTANDIIISNFIAGNRGNQKIKIFDKDEEISKYLKLNNEIKYLPKDGEKIKSFEDIAGEGNFNKLACLKGDIDNLGKLFMFGLNENNYKENYKLLSEKLDNFWNKKLYEIIGNKEIYKDIYIVYAGGDDFLILGKWDVIIDFYKDLQNKFKEFTNNDEIQSLLKEKQNITFCGAINLFGQHDTFFTVVKQTDELLSKAKDGDKNSLNIFGKVIGNDDFGKLFDEINKFEKEFNLYDKEKNIISTGTLRFLLDISKKIILDEKKGLDENGNEKDYFEYGLWKAELFYMLGRNYTTKNGTDLKDDFRSYINGMILHNEAQKFGSLSGNNDLFGDKTSKEDAEKLFVMMSYVLYKLRS